MKLAIFGGPKTTKQCGPHLVWPRITKAIEDAVVKQLHTTVSIYNRSGVIEEFENTFSRYHNRRYALLSNSGTNAIYSMYEGLGLGPGDEVICPVYTFFATVSPLMHTGANPVFCDCKFDGNIDPVEIEKAITHRTRAVIITHMWGLPCDMEEITFICRKYNLRLLEDCSHAHGARINGKLVGTFGDAAAWSLQAQKTITGGEGGVMVTDDKDVYFRALLQGHYNKRCKQEIPKDHSLSEFGTTGFGLKFRAHPLSIAIAQEQFPYLEEWLAKRQCYAERMTSAFQQYPFIRLPETSGKQHGWYAYVMQFDPSVSNGIDVDLFAKAVLAEGLCEFDQPRSTGMLHCLPLFSNPERAFPRLYLHPSDQVWRSFPQAEHFCKNALKVPVWSFPDEEWVVELYIEGISKVASVVRDDPEILLAIQSTE